MVMERNPEICHAVRRILESLGHKVIESRTEVDLIHYLEQVNVWPDLLLFEIIPDRSAMESTQALINPPKWCYIPFLLSRTISREKEEALIKLQRALGIVSKIFDIDAFERYISFALLATS